MKRLVLSALVFAALAAAAVDGRYSAKMDRTGHNKKNAGATVTREIVFDLKSDGGTLTGTIGGSNAKRGPVSIQNGKVDGDKFSFTTVQGSKKGVKKFDWQGSVTGDELHATRTPEGRKHGMEIVATRQ